MQRTLEVAGRAITREVTRAKVIAGKASQKIATRASKARRGLRLSVAGRIHPGSPRDDRNGPAGDEDEEGGGTSPRSHAAYGVTPSVGSDRSVDHVRGGEGGAIGGKRIGSSDGPVRGGIVRRGSAVHFDALSGGRAQREMKDAPTEPRPQFFVKEIASMSLKGRDWCVSFAQRLCFRTPWRPPFLPLSLLLLPVLVTLIPACFQGERFLRHNCSSGVDSGDRSVRCAVLLQGSGVAGSS